MTNQLNALLILVLVINLFALGTSRILAVIRIVALQGALLGLLPFLVHQQCECAGHSDRDRGRSALKGFVIPAIMIRALRDAQIKREVEPLIGFLPSILLGAAATAFALLFSSQSAARSGTCRLAARARPRWRPS